MHVSAVRSSMILLGVLAAMQGVGTIAIDLGRTHAGNREWPGHARFHVIWHVVNVVLLSVGAEVVLWSGVLPEGVRFYVALGLTVIPLLGFLGALAARRVFGATLGDRKGMPPLVVWVGGRRRAIDMNTVAVGAGLLVAAGLLYLHDGMR